MIGEKVRGNHKKALDSILKLYPNVIGFSTTYQPRIRKGKVHPEETVLRVYVSKKVPLSQLRAEQVIPQTVDGFPIDVVELGEVKALVDRTDFFRPLLMGISVSGGNVTAGTLSIPFKDAKGNVYLSSNAHVLVDNPSQPPDQITNKVIKQPGNYDIASHGWNTSDPKYVVGEYFWHQQIHRIGENSECDIAKVWSGIYNSIARVFKRKTRLVPMVEEANKIDFALFKPSVEYKLEVLELDISDKKFVGLLFAGCFDKDTRIFTDEGFKHFYELTGKELVMTLNPENGNVEWQPIEMIHEYPYSGKMVSFEGRNYSLLVTPNHRMVLKDKNGIKFIQAGELYNFVHEKIKRKSEKANNYKRFLELYKKGLKLRKIAEILGVSHYTVEDWLYNRKYSYKIVSKPTYSSLQTLNLRIPATGKWECSDLSYIEIPGVGKVAVGDWVKFFGWYITEGSTTKRYNRKSKYISFTQKDEKYANEIVESVKGIGLKPNVYKCGKYFVIRVHNTLLAEYLARYGKAREKYIPKEILMLPPEKLKTLLEIMMKGDGYKRDKVYNTLSKRLAENLVELAIKCGYAVTFKERTCKYSYKPGTYRKYEVYVRSKYVTPFIENPPELVDYSGYVYCVSVPNKIILVERNGKVIWSGNSDYSTIICKASNIIEKGYTPLTEWAEAKLNGIIFKSGRTTGTTKGTVFDVSGNVTVNYGSFNAWFEDIIIATAMSQPGDSGSFTCTSL